MKIDRVTNFISTNRFADFIFSANDAPYSVRVVTTLHDNPRRVLFHTPRYRFPHISDDCKKLLKYSSQYVEVSSEWFINTPPSRRISTIVGLELYLRGEFEKASNQDGMLHLKKLLEVSKDTIGDDSRLENLEPQYLSRNISEIDIFSIELGAARFTSMENLVAHKSRECRENVVSVLRGRLSGDRFDMAAAYLSESINDDDDKYFGVEIEKMSPSI